MVTGGAIDLHASEQILVINPAEAKNRPAYLRALSRAGLRAPGQGRGRPPRAQTKRRTTARGIERGGQPFARGHLYRLLSNPIYAGQIAHRIAFAIARSRFCWQVGRPSARGVTSLEYSEGNSPSGVAEVARRRSVHAAAAGSPFLMSPIVRIPAEMALSPHRRSPDQNALLHLGPQNRCGEPPRRARKGFSHHWHSTEVASVMTAA